MTDLHSILVNKAPDAILALSAEGKILFWNKTAENIFGYTSTEAMNASIKDLIGPVTDGSSQGTGAEMSGLVQEAMARKKEGTLIYVDISRKPVLDERGALQFIAVNITDVTQAKVQRDAFMIANKFGGLLESVPDAIVLVNHTGRIVLANSNSEKLFGYTQQQMIGEMIEVLMPARFRQGHVAHRTRFSAEPKTRAMGAALELFGIRKDGTEFPVEVSLSPLQTEHGMMVISAIRDISERKQQEEMRRRALQDTNRVKSEFLAKMSHELRTPLNSVIGFTEFMLDETPGALNPKQKEYLQDIRNSGKHLLNLINTILDLAKIEAGKIQFDPEEFEVKAAFQQVCSAFLPLAKTKNLRLKTEVAEDCGFVTLDFHKLKQILYNLLSNAIKFTDEGGTVEVHATKIEETLIVTVRDTGIGIREQDIPRLFTDFQQLDSGASRRYEGSGLGLVVTKKLVDLQSGSIQVQSKFGSGTSFIIKLPCRFTVS
jgi:PAS domain S-box-containing protein